MPAEGGWETIKRRRPRRPPAVPRGAGAKTGAGAADGTSREEVLRTFEAARRRWSAEWDALPCRVSLGQILKRVRADLKAEAGGAEGRDGPVAGGASAGRDGAQPTPSTDIREPARGGTPEGDAGKAPAPRRPSGLACTVCLGLGSFEDDGWEAVRRAWMQYFALLAIVEVLDPSLPVIFQEPDFTPGDRIFLESRGHTVVDDPAAFEAIAADPGAAVVVGFHLYASIYRRALKPGLPKVFVGTGWDVWDNINKGDEVPELKRLDETHRSEAFPQDQTVSTFSSTSICWVPAAAGDGGRAEEGEGVRGSKDAEDLKASEDLKDVEGSQGAKASKDVGDSKDAEDSKDAGDSKDMKDSDAKDSKDAKDSRDGGCSKGQEGLDGSHGG